ncbi:hypothetical protein NAT47_10365 [Flavobacterium sp. HXWNR69]|uniref:Uncharacterized protein n=1 Tax=Flavobacterium fragile TaxID=2949085 RepID=A0ABT0TKD5_9FLAO|nr:hypothetical protein [Flavobacterium sp. HXWNR69]MCL9770820.1 hypothetical protein [Flavobacterium sp. HXWNR69]
MTPEPKTSETIPQKNNRGTMLLLSLLFDAVGMMSYIVPVFSEITDIFWAPVSALILILMYKGPIGKLAGIFGLVEELLPMVDMIPTFTITWFYTYVIRGCKEQE